MAVDASNSGRSRPRLAVVLSHPIQYISPWFTQIVARGCLDLKVFYLWDFGVTPRYDPQFGRTIKWDIPLLEGYEHEFVPNRSRQPGTHHFLGLDNPRIVDRISKWSPDAIILFGYRYMTHMRVLCSPRLRRIPLFLRGDSHDLYRPSSLKSTLALRVRAVLFRRFTGFLAVGKANADYYRRCSIPESRIHFVPHAAERERFRAAARTAARESARWKHDLGIPNDAAVALFAGKFDPNKRPLDLLHAFLKVRARFAQRNLPSPALLFVGDGALENELRSGAGDQIGRSVFFAPFQNQSRMPAIYAAADLVVLPSQSETWGMAVHEAMNVGRPVVVSSHVGCGPDLVRDGETGWIFEAGDVDALAFVLERALEDRDRLAAMGTAASNHVRNYSYEAATAGLEEVIGRVRA